MIDRIFVDANILISAFAYPKGICGKALRKALEKELKIITSDYVIYEVEKVLSKKFSNLALEKFREFLKLAEISVLKSPSLDEVLRYTQYLSDKEDAPILAFCVINDIPLVSGDKVFHTEKVRKLIKVFSCSELLSLLE